MHTNLNGENTNEPQQHDRSSSPNSNYGGDDMNYNEYQYNNNHNNHHINNNNNNKEKANKENKIIFLLKIVNFVPIVTIIINQFHQK